MGGSEKQSPLLIYGILRKNANFVKIKIVVNFVEKKSFFLQEN